MEPMRENDVLIYQPADGLATDGGVLVTMVPLGQRWALSGLAEAEVYSEVFRSFKLKNDGPRVDINGNNNRTLWFEVTDEEGRTVRPRSRSMPCASLPHG